MKPVTVDPSIWKARRDGVMHSSVKIYHDELQQVLVGGFFHGSCLSEVTTSCCNTVLILMVAKQKKRKIMTIFTSMDGVKLKKVFRTGFKCSVDE